MSYPPTYTPLESFLVFQSILSQGIDAAAFARISDGLRNNGLVKGDHRYDAARLSPEALQQFFFRLFQEEFLRGDVSPPAAAAAAAGTAGAADGSTSPNSKKRKIASPPLPTLKDVYDNIDKIPVLVNRLYARYREITIKQIREDEARFETLQNEISVIEKSENQRLARLASQQQQNASPAAPAGASPTPAAAAPPRTAATALHPPAPASASKKPALTTPVVPPRLPPSPAIAAPSHLAPGATTPARPAVPAAQPPAAVPPSSVLQAPVGVTQQPGRVLQAPGQAPNLPISPRPEMANPVKAAPPTPQQPPATPSQSTLKWEKPYQPPQPAHTPPPRQTASPVPRTSTTPQLPQQQQQQKHVPALPPWQHHQVPYPQQQQQQQRQQQQQYQQQHQQHQQQQHQHQQQLQHQQHQQQYLQQQLQHQPQQPQPQPQQPQHQQPQTPVPAPAPPPVQTPTKPVVVPPPAASQNTPQLQKAPLKPAGTAQSPQPRQAGKTPVPTPQPRPAPPQQTQPGQQPRPISASPAPAAGTTPHTQAPPQRWTPGHAQQGAPIQAQPAVPPASPAAAAPHQDKPYTSPYGTHHPRPAIPEHMIRHAAAGTPLTARRTSVLPPQPQTPVQNTPMSVLRGLGTKWAPHPSPSTPGAVMGEPQSPAFEPMSPPQRAAPLPRPTPKNVPKKQPLKPAHETPSGKPGRGRPPRRQSQMKRGASATPSAEASRRSQSVASQSEATPVDRGNLAATPKVKDEEATPRLHEETGDTTADESIAGRGNLATLKGSSRHLKRKRNESLSHSSSANSSQVLWTRGFTKVSSSALDQISSHRDANMFATRLRERDAPNYRQIVLQPQDITSIRSAIKQGNKAAVAAAGNLPGGDPGTASVYLPYSEDIVPPRGIINSAQLERELVHMFCNAIMYNPDPDRGPGPAFMKRSQEDEEEVFGYHLDENGVVRNTQSMFLEVEKLLGDLRSAEKDRTAPSLSTPRPNSVATPAEDTAEDEEDAAGEGEQGQGTAKRRRVRA